jgi:hypothetical protein
MATIKSTRPACRLTAEELRRLPADQRDRVLRSAAESAEADYRTDPTLAGFDAFGDNDQFRLRCGVTSGL